MVHATGSGIAGARSLAAMREQPPEVLTPEQMMQSAVEMAGKELSGWDGNALPPRCMEFLKMFERAVQEDNATSVPHTVRKAAARLAFELSASPSDAGLRAAELYGRL